MLEIIILLAILCTLCGIGFWVTGTILKAFIWLFIQVPIACILIIIGMAICFTIFLIPLGARLIGWALRLILPGL